MEIENQKLIFLSSQWFDSLSDEQKETVRKYAIKVMKAQGYTYSEIEQVTSIQRGTISKAITKFEEKNDVLATNYSNCGRKSILARQSKEMIVEELRDNNQTTQMILQNKLKESLNIEVSKQTIDKFQQEIGSFKYPVEIPMLSSTNQIKRLEYCKEYQYDRFSNVAFTDESSFQMCRTTRKVFVFKDDLPFQKTTPNPNFTVMIWGAISRKGKIGISFVEGTLNRFGYIELLKQFIPHIPDKKQSKNNWRFLHDYAPCHRVTEVREWLLDKTIKTLKHPPQSPTQTQLTQSGVK